VRIRTLAVTRAAAAREVKLADAGILAERQLVQA
jgi:hypothetical protein